MKETLKDFVIENRGTFGLIVGFISGIVSSYIVLLLSIGI